MRLALGLALALSVPDVAAAQDAPAAPGDAIAVTPLGALQLTPSAETAPAGGVLRALDKISGALVDLTIAPGQSQRIGRLSVTLSECRYPTLNPNGDAFAFVTITNDGTAEPVFAGWMIASSPALNALDDPRYDVWALRCNIAAAD